MLLELANRAGTIELPEPKPPTSIPWPEQGSGRILADCHGVMEWWGPFPILMSWRALGVTGAGPLTAGMSNGYAWTLPPWADSVRFRYRARGFLPRPDVAVLFARRNSVYKRLTGCQVFDLELNALTFEGKQPVIAHPPCRAWGRLRHFAKPRKGEKDLARFAIRKIRENGGVLEHPHTSTLWADMGLPLPGKGLDAFGGWTLPIDQFWFGHRAQKRTYLYICGCEPRQVPDMPLKIGRPTHVVNTRMRAGDGSLFYRPSVNKTEREATPVELAEWLVELARKCG